MLALQPLSGAMGRRTGAPHAVGGGGMFGEWFAWGLGSWSPTADGGEATGTLLVPLLGWGGFSMSCRPPCFLTHPPRQSDGSEGERRKLCAGEANALPGS